MSIFDLGHLDSRTGIAPGVMENPSDSTSVPANDEFSLICTVRHLRLLTVHEGYRTQDTQLGAVSTPSKAQLKKQARRAEKASKKAARAVSTSTASLSSNVGAQYRSEY